MSVITVATVKSPVGDVSLVSRDGVLVAVTFKRSEARVPISEDDTLEICRRTPASDALGRYFDGDLAAVDTLDADPEGTPFQKRIWRALRKIPAGDVISYGDLARRVGNPRASRAVGGATGANPVAIVIPCHRVIGADGSLTGYGGGLKRKRWLLEHERRQIELFSGGNDEP